MGGCAHYIMVSKVQWKPFWLVTSPIYRMTGLVAKTHILWHMCTAPICSKFSIKSLHSCHCLNSELNTFLENVVIFFAPIIIYHNIMLITGNKKLCGVFGWNIAQEWGRKWALKRKNSRKNILVFSSLAKRAMNWCLVAVFFLIGIGFICKKNFRKTFQRLLGRIPRCFCDQLTFSITQVLTHFLEFLKICAKMFPFFSLKW